MSQKYYLTDISSKLLNFFPAKMSFQFKGWEPLNEFTHQYYYNSY